MVQQQSVSFPTTGFFTHLEGIVPRKQRGAGAATRFNTASKAATEEPSREMEQHSLEAGGVAGDAHDTAAEAPAAVQTPVSSGAPFKQQQQQQRPPRLLGHKRRVASTSLQDREAHRRAKLAATAAERAAAEAAVSTSLPDDNQVNQQQPAGALPGHAPPHPRTPLPARSTKERSLGARMYVDTPVHDGVRGPPPPEGMERHRQCFWCRSTVEVGANLLGCATCPRAFCFKCFKHRPGFGINNWARSLKDPHYVCAICRGAEAAENEGDAAPAGSVAPPALPPPVPGSQLALQMSQSASPSPARPSGRPPLASHSHGVRQPRSSVRSGPGSRAMTARARSPMPASQPPAVPSPQQQRQQDERAQQAVGKRVPSSISSSGLLDKAGSTVLVHQLHVARRPPAGNILAPLRSAAQASAFAAPASAGLPGMFDAPFSFGPAWCESELGTDAKSEDGNSIKLEALGQKPAPVADSWSLQQSASGLSQPLSAMADLILLDDTALETLSQGDTLVQDQVVPYVSQAAEFGQVAMPAFFPHMVNLPVANSVPALDPLPSADANAMIESWLSFGDMFAAPEAQPALGASTAGHFRQGGRSDLTGAARGSHADHLQASLEAKTAVSNPAGCRPARPAAGRDAPRGDDAAASPENSLPGSSPAAACACVGSHAQQPQNSNTAPTSPAPNSGAHNARHQQHSPQQHGGANGMNRLRGGTGCGTADAGRQEAPEAACHPSLARQPLQEVNPTTIAATASGRLAPVEKPVAASSGVLTAGRQGSKGVGEGDSWSLMGPTRSGRPLPGQSRNRRRLLDHASSGPSAAGSGHSAAATWVH